MVPVAGINDSKQTGRRKCGDVGDGVVVGKRIRVMNSVHEEGQCWGLSESAERKFSEEVTKECRRSDKGQKENNSCYRQSNKDEVRRKETRFSRASCR